MCLYILMVAGILLLSRSSIALRMSRFAGGLSSTVLSGFSSPEFSSKFSIPDTAADKEVNSARSPIILGSGSSSRRMILSNAGYIFDVVKADLDERAIGDRSDGNVEPTKVLVELLANAKADEIMRITPILPTATNMGLMWGDR